MSRAWTQKEVQAQFLHACWQSVRFWTEHGDSLEEKLTGLMHSFLVLLDGCHMTMPAMEVIPIPCLTDEEYHRREGSNFYQPFKLPEGTVTVHGGDMLHELMYPFGRQHGYLRDTPKDKP